jgi:hypothetical protein
MENKRGGTQQFSLGMARWPKAWWEAEVLQMYRGTDNTFPDFLNHCVRWWWAVSFTLTPLWSREKCQRHTFCTNLVGCLGACLLVKGKKIFAPTGTPSTSLQVATCVTYACHYGQSRKSVNMIGFIHNRKYLETHWKMRHCWIFLITNNNQQLASFPSPLVYNFTSHEAKAQTTFNYENTLPTLDL